MEMAQRAGEMKFSMYDREDYPLVEGVTQFQHPGRALEYTLNDWSEVH